MYQLNELEHRWGERFSLDLPVLVAVNTVSGIDARLKNLSLSGALLNADFALRIHTVIDVRLPVLPSALPTPSIKAYVIRKFNQEFGVEWRDFAPSAIKVLLRSLSR
ncbi:MAG: PilZ domain-containing protein [Gammaproteobacteria bacterium]